MITTLTGENDAMRLREQTQIMDEFVARYTDMGLERFDGESVTYEQLLGAVQSLPFLVERKLVVVRSPSLNKDFIEHFDEFCSACIDQTDVLIVEEKLDKRSSYYKQLKKLTDFHEYNVLDAAQLAGYAVQYVKDNGGTLAAADARYLVERIGTNQLSLEHDLDKLLNSSPTIVRSAIDVLTDAIPQSKIFDLLDAAFTGHTERTLALYKDQRAQGVEPQQIIAMLVWQLYIFAVVKAGQAKTTAAIVEAAKLSPYTVQKSQALMRKTSLQRLKAMITHLRVLDERSKSEGIVLDEALQYYLLTLA